MKLLATLTDSLDPGFGRIAAVDLEREDAEIVLEWLPPPSLRTSGKGFLGIAWLGVPGQSDLVACAHGGLCRIDPATWTVTGVLSQPCMNDLHHAAVHDGRLLVANTGLDRIDVFETSGRFVGGWDLSPGWMTAERLRGCNPSRPGWAGALQRGWQLESTALENEPFTGDLEQRASSSLPFPTRKTRHFVHPNHVTMLEGRPLVTRFLDRSIQDLADWSLAIPETPGHPHDGELHGDCFWITCTSGLIVGYAIEKGRLTSREVKRIDIPQHIGRSGWCRGLIVTDQLIVVSLTTVQYMPPFGWSDPDLSKTETSILAIDPRTLKLVARVDFQRFGQLPKVFGLVEFPSTAEKAAV
ncbi:MAG: hypothetical protein QOI12_3348 [Alphaproteobacteria bacterium]|nr:hypothetical protein [Alphaproteobacteria bacterium]